MTKETTKLTIQTVEEKNGFLPPEYKYAGKYSSNSMVKNGYKAKSLLINGILEDGREVFFWTPSSIIAYANGMLNYEKLESVNGWYIEEKDDIVGHGNDLHYEGSTEMAVAIEDKTKIVPGVKVGDEINITFKVDFQAGNGKYKLSRVKLK